MVLEVLEVVWEGLEVLLMVLEVDLRLQKPTRKLQKIYTNPSKIWNKICKSPKSLRVGSISPLGPTQLSFSGVIVIRNPLFFDLALSSYMVLRHADFMLNRVLYNRTLWGSNPSVGHTLSGCLCTPY